MSDYEELQAVAKAKSDLTNEEQVQFEAHYSRQRKSPTVAFLLSFFFGGLGVDRFYLGQMGLGIAKLLTLGGIGVWIIVDWFLISRAAHERNMDAIRHIKRILIMARSEDGSARSIRST
jgi:TM2 domain-containing membrane protein YozV